MNPKIALSIAISLLAGSAQGFDGRAIGAIDQQADGSTINRIQATAANRQGFLGLDAASAIGTLEEVLSGVDVLIDPTQVEQLQFGSCPLVTIDGDLDPNPQAPSAEVTVTVDYGEGCTDALGLSHSGNKTATYSVTGLNGIGLLAEYDSQYNSVTLEQMPIANGRISGDIALRRTGLRSWDGALGLSFDAFYGPAGPGVEQGDMNLAVTGYHPGARQAGEHAFDSISVGVEALVIGDFELNGSIDVEADGYDADDNKVWTVSTDVTFSIGADGIEPIPGLELGGDVDVLIDLFVTQVRPDSYWITSPSEAEPGQVGDYEVLVQDVLIDPQICADTPAEGMVTVIQGPLATDITWVDCQRQVSRPYLAD
jgi:hypothetical protein